MAPAAKERRLQQMRDWLFESRSKCIESQGSLRRWPAHVSRARPRHCPNALTQARGSSRGTDRTMAAADSYRTKPKSPRKWELQLAIGAGEAEAPPMQRRAPSHSSKP